MILGEVEFISTRERSLLSVRIRWLTIGRQRDVGEFSAATESLSRPQRPRPLTSLPVIHYDIVHVLAFGILPFLGGCARLAILGDDALGGHHGVPAFLADRLDGGVVEKISQKEKASENRWPLNQRYRLLLRQQHLTE